MVTRAGAGMLCVGIILKDGPVSLALAEVYAAMSFPIVNHWIYFERQHVVLKFR